MCIQPTPQRDEIEVLFVYSRDRTVPRPRRESHRVLTSGDRMDQFDLGRLCVTEGCTTRLSRYNPSDHCGVHRGWADTAVRSYG